jgi:D-glycero-D-manno-heptose 1,7-bisphosphate phosphatase
VTTGRRAAFLDRDGVLNEDHGYVWRIEDFHWLPGVIGALQRLQQAGFALVVITNQSGIARGLYGLEELDDLHTHMRQQLQLHGVSLAGVYACPHHPEGTRPGYARACDCRKPQPGMILQAARELELDLAASCLFGDKPSDVDAGRAAGVGRCWLLGERQADAPDLAAAVDQLLQPA